MDMSTSAELAVFEFNLAIHRLEAIKKAAYKYSGKFNVHLGMVDNGEVRVTLSRKNNRVVDVADADGFANEVLDQELRELVARETEGVRNLLLAQAFSSFAILDPVGETADYNQDPLGIGLGAAPSYDSSQPTEDPARDPKRPTH